MAAMAALIAPLAQPTLVSPPTDRHAGWLSIPFRYHWAQREAVIETISSFESSRTTARPQRGGTVI